MKNGLQDTTGEAVCQVLNATINFMKHCVMLITLLLPVTTVIAEEKKVADYNPAFQKLIEGATRIVVRDGGDICCKTPAETLKQRVYFEIKDAGEIKQVAANIQFKKGTRLNGCMCCGHPGIDWYVGKKRVAITAVKHGMGLMRDSVVATFTPESKEWMSKWLVSHGYPDE